MTAPLTDFSKLCIHTVTTKPWSLQEAIAGYQRAGVPAITVWRQAIEPVGTDEASRMLKDSGLAIVSLCRGGFFPATDADQRQAAIDENKRVIDEAQAIGAPLIVLVCGAVPGQSLEDSRKQITDGIAACLPHAEAAGVKLAIEPLHPMYAGDRSAVNTMGQARRICEQLKHPMLGIAADVYHIWFDDQLEQELRLAGEQNTLFAFHICDWRLETRDLLMDRGLMGEGCINIPTIRGWAEAAGWDGFNEVEIFSNWHWEKPMDQFVEEIKAAYLAHS